MFPCDWNFQPWRASTVHLCERKKTGGRVSGHPGGFSEGKCGTGCEHKEGDWNGKLAGAHKDGRPKATVRFGGETELGEGQIGLFHKGVKTCMCPIRKKTEYTHPHMYTYTG